MLLKSFKHSTVALAAVVTIQSFGFQSFAQPPKPQSPQQAQQSQPQAQKLSIDDLLNAIDDNSALKKAEDLVGVARGQLRVYKDSRLPTLIAAVGPQINNGHLVTSATATITLPVFTGFVLQNEILTAQHNVNAASFNIPLARQQLSYQAKLYYYEVQKAIDTKNAELKAVKAATEFLAQATEQLHDGLSGSAIDVANANVALANANEAVAAAQASIETNCHGLLDILQKDLSDQALCLNLTDNNPPVAPTMTEAEAESFALTNRPDLASLGETIQANIATAHEYDPISALSVGFAASDTRATAQNGAGNVGNSILDLAGVPTTSSGNNWSVGISGQYKFDPTRRGQHDTALWTAHANEHQLDVNQRAVKQQVQDAYSNLNNAYQQATQAKIAYKNQLLQYTIAKTQLGLGQLLSLLYIQVIANTAAAEAAYNVSQKNISESVNALQFAIGQVTAQNQVMSQQQGGLP